MKLSDEELIIIRNALATEHTTSLPPTTKEKVYALLNKINKELTRHNWKVSGIPGIYDTDYICTKCNKVYSTSMDNNSNRPEFGCTS